MKTLNDPVPFPTLYTKHAILRLFILGVHFSYLMDGKLMCGDLVSTMTFIIAQIACIWLLAGMDAFVTQKVTLLFRGERAKSAVISVKDDSHHYSDNYIYIYARYC